jgi:hypothetical protein
MGIKNSVLDYIRSKELTWYSDIRRINEERLSQKIWNGVRLEEEEEVEEEGKTSKFVDAESNNWKEREGN